MVMTELIWVAGLDMETVLCARGPHCQWGRKPPCKYPYPYFAIRTHAN